MSCPYQAPDSSCDILPLKSNHHLSEGFWEGKKNRMVTMATPVTASETNLQGEGHKHVTLAPDRPWTGRLLLCAQVRCGYQGRPKLLPRMPQGILLLPNKKLVLIKGPRIGTLQRQGFERQRILGSIGHKGITSLGPHKRPECVRLASAWVLPGTDSSAPERQSSTPAKLGSTGLTAPPNPAFTF